MLFGSSSYHLAFGREGRHNVADTTHRRTYVRTIYLNIDIDILEKLAAVDSLGVRALSTERKNHTALERVISVSLTSSFL